MKSTLPGWLKAELAPDPERIRRTGHITLSVLAVLVVMLAVRMPFLSIGPYLVFLLAQDETLSTRIGALLGIAVDSVSCLLIFLIAAVAFDAPWLRLALFSASFFGCYYLICTLSEPKAVLGPLVVLTLFMGAFDQVPSATYLFTQLAWLWAVLLLVVAVTLLSQWLCGIPTATELVRMRLNARMAAAAAALRSKPERWSPLPGARAKLYETLERMVLAGLLQPRQADNYATLMTLFDRIEALARSESRSSGSCRARFGAAARRVEVLAHAITAERPLPPRNAASDDALLHLPEGLRETIEIAENTWVGMGSRSPASAEAPVAPALIKEDFFTNPLHAAFAARATAATMACYLIMSALHWQGIHTCMVTCAVTALVTAGAQVRKQALRLLGAAVGGALGIAAMVAVIPHLDSLPGLLLVVGTVSALAGWISLGSVRTSYAGWQIALAFFMTVLQEPHPTTSLDVLRDRWVGIVLGIVAMRVAFDFGWPQSALDLLRIRIVETRDTIEQFMDRATNAIPTAAPARLCTREIATSLAMAGDLLAEAEIERSYSNEGMGSSIERMRTEFAETGRLFTKALARRTC